MKFTSVSSVRTSTKGSINKTSRTQEVEEDEDISRSKKKKVRSDEPARKKSAQFDATRSPKHRKSFNSSGEEKKRRMYEQDAPEQVEQTPPVVSPSRPLLRVDQSSRSMVVSPEAVEALKSRFGERTDVILRHIESENTDGATTMIYQALLTALVDLIPVMEHAVRKTGGSRGVYQFNQTVSQIRELLGDIQSLRDRGTLGASVVERHVRPSFMNIGVQIVQALTLVSEAARERMTREDYKSFRDGVVHSVKMGLADYIKLQHDEVSSAIVQSLS